jgi:hypothetical protein
VVRKRIREREAWMRKDSGISVGEEERRVVREELGTGIEKMVGDGSSPNSRVDIAYPELGRTWEREREREIAPSPLGLSNYDALDDEDGDYGYFDEEGSESEDGASLFGSTKSSRMEKREKEEDGEYYSDWNCFNNTEEEGKNEDEEDEYDDPFSLSVLSSVLAKEKRPPSPPDGRVMEFLKESEREKEVLMMGFNAFG